MLGCSMLFMYATITDGMPSWLATSLAIAGALIACFGLERLIPYRDDWRASQAAQQTDLVHIVLTELTGRVDRERSAWAPLRHSLSIRLHGEVWARIQWRRSISRSAEHGL